MKQICDHAEFDSFRTTPVLEFKQGDVLYRKDKPATHFTLILSGKMKVVAGKEGFISELGPWSSLGSQVLAVKQGTYNADFHASVLSETLRCIRFSNKQLETFQSNTTKNAVANEKKATESNGIPHEEQE